MAVMMPVAAVRVLPRSGHPGQMSECSRAKVRQGACPGEVTLRGGRGGEGARRAGECGVEENDAKRQAVPTLPPGRTGLAGAWTHWRDGG